MNWTAAAYEYYKQTFSHDCRLASLPAEWQRELVALYLVDDEINNGGYLQFFVNRGRGVYRYATRGLNVIGASRMAAIIDRCQALIDEHDPTGNDSRNTLLPNEIIAKDGTVIKEPGSVLPDSVLDRLSDLSWEYMNYPDSVGDSAPLHFDPLIAADRRGG